MARRDPRRTRLRNQAKTLQSSGTSATQRKATAAAEKRLTGVARANFARAQRRGRGGGVDRQRINEAQRTASLRQARLQARRIGALAASRQRDANQVRADFRKRSGVTNAQSAAIKAGVPTRTSSNLNPFPRGKSAFIVVGGKAIPKDAIGSIRATEQQTSKNIPLSQRARSNFVISAPQKTGDPRIDAVFAGQQAATRRIAETFVQNRLKALSGGATTDQAALIAQRQTAGLSKAQANAINTALQKDIIEEKEGQIRLAEELIKIQTTEGEAGDLDNLAGQLANAPSLAVTKVPIQLDSAGNDINPRRTKLTIENAILTGQTLDDLELDVTVDQNAPVFDRGGFISGDLTTGELNIQPLETIFPTGVLDLQGLTAEQIIDQTSTGQFSGVQALIENVRASRIIQGDTNLEEVSKLTPTVAQEEFQQPTSLIENAFESINPSDLSFEETADGLIVFTNGAGEEVFRGTPAQAVEFLNSFFNTQQAATQEQREEFTKLIEELRRRISLGEGLAGILEQLLALLGGIPRGTTQTQGKQQETKVTTTAGTFDGILSFFSGIIAAIVAFFTKLTGGATVQ